MNRQPIRRGRRRVKAIPATLCAAALALGVGGCSTDKPVTRAELSQRFQSNAKLSKSFSDCLADRMFAASGSAKLDDNEKLALKKDEAAKDTTKLLVTKVSKAKQACAKKGTTAG